jgi:hypothetical protein
VEVEVVSWLTKPGETTVITTFTTTTVTKDETETVTSTRPATTITPGDDDSSPNNMPQVFYDKGEATIPDPPKITTTFITTYTMLRATEDDEDGAAYFQPAATTTFTTTYRSGSVKTVPIEITTTGPSITYAVTGKTTILSTFTVDPVQGKQIMGPTTRTLTSDVPAFLSTIIETPAPIVRTTYGPDGLPTAVTETFPPVTRVITVPASRVILTDVSTPTVLQDLVIVSATTYTLTTTGYYVGKFVPVLVAVVLVLAIRAVDMAAQQYQPFASLARPKGAKGRDSLTLDFEGWGGLWRPLRLARQGQWVPFLATTAYYLSIAIPSVASEAIGIKVHGRCSLSAIQGCALQLGVSRMWSYILAGLLVVTALALLVVLIVVSRHWRTGVFADPWCVAGAAALARNHEVAQSVCHPDFRAVKADVAERYYALGWFRNADGREEYGLVLQGDRRDEGGVVMMPQAGHPDASWGVGPQDGRSSAKVRRPPRTFAVLTVWWRLLLLIYLLALLGVVLFYHGRRTLVPEKVRWFMEGGNRYGARFITSGLGVAAMIGWDCIFDSIAVVAPYRLMADKPQPGSRSALAGRPTYAVTGVWAGIRNRDWLLGLAAFMTVLAHFLPILFANVPYNLTQMEVVHSICSKLSAGLLALMVVVLGAFFFVHWPEMPVDPRSIAGQMWYVAQSSAVDVMDGVSSLDGRERKRRLEMLEARWTFGAVRTPFGHRVTVELLDFRGAPGPGGQWS